MLDDEFVIIESLGGEQLLRAPEQTGPILQAFEVLRRAATSGDFAVALIQRVAAELRN